MLREASQQFAAVGKRAADAEDNLRHVQLQNLENEVRFRWEQLTTQQEDAARDHRRREFIASIHSGIEGEFHGSFGPNRNRQLDPGRNRK